MSEGHRGASWRRLGPAERLSSAGGQQASCGIPPSQDTSGAGTLGSTSCSCHTPSPRPRVGRRTSTSGRLAGTRRAPARPSGQRSGDTGRNTRTPRTHTRKSERKTGISAHAADSPHSRCTHPDAGPTHFTYSVPVANTSEQDGVGGQDHGPGATTPQHLELRSMYTHCPGNVGISVTRGHHFSLHK